MGIQPRLSRLVNAGAPVVELYHLVQGVCVARTSSGIHIDTLAEGSALGHLDAVLGTPCGADILAKTYCTMYCLSVTELLEVFEVRQSCLCAQAGYCLGHDVTRPKTYELELARILTSRSTRACSKVAWCTHAELPRGGKPHTCASKRGA